MAPQTTLSPARVVGRLPRRRSTQFLRRKTALRQAISLLRRWRERMRMRRQARNLCELDDHVLQDIGLTRAELFREAAKPYAPPPSSRRKAATAFDTADLRTLAIAWQSSLASSGKGGVNVSESSVVLVAAPNRWRQLLFGIICMSMIANLQYGWTLFVNPIHDEQGWTRAAIQVAFTVFVFTRHGWFRSRVGSSTATGRGSL